MGYDSLGQDEVRVFNGIQNKSLKHPAKEHMRRRKRRKIFEELIFTSIYNSPSVLLGTKERNTKTQYG